MSAGRAARDAPVLGLPDADRGVQLKKPVVNEFVDLRSLAGRLANCRAEVQLNRRLAGDVYRGLAQVTQSANGELAIDGDGRVIDWLVRMRRLPAEHMLDWLLEHERLQPEDVAAVARRLGDFFAAQPAIALAAGRHRMLLRQQLDLSRAMLARPEFGLPLQQIGAVHSAMERYLDDGADLAARVRMGRIVEGHGDLRPEHICLGAPPVIIDCLEFSRDLRLLDPFDEFAFLGLECARRARPGWRRCCCRHSRRASTTTHRCGWAFYTALPRLRACTPGGRPPARTGAEPAATGGRAHSTIWRAPAWPAPRSPSARSQRGGQQRRRADDLQASARLGPEAPGSGWRLSVIRTAASEGSRSAASAPAANTPCAAQAITRRAPWARQVRAARTSVLPVLIRSSTSTTVAPRTSPASRSPLTTPRLRRFSSQAEPQSRPSSGRVSRETVVHA